MFEIIIPIMHKSCIKETLEHYKKMDNISNIVLVDFSPEYTSKILNNSLNGIQHIKIFKENTFNKSAALNIGLSKSSSDYLICCDADVLIDKLIIENWELQITNKKDVFIYLEEIVERKCGSKRPGWGIVCGERKAFLQVNGYDSLFEGWGFEDLDIISRINNYNYTISSSGTGVHISHDDCERVMNYKNKNIIESRQFNLSRFFRKTLEHDMLGTLQSDLEEYLD